MKIITDRDRFIAALTPALGFNISRNTVSYADGVLLECPGDSNLPHTVRITSYDLERGMRTSVEAEVVEPGNYIINTQKLMSIVRALPAGRISITVDEKFRAIIEGGMSRFEINAGKGEDFPMLPLLYGKKRYDIPQYMMRSLVNGVLYAVAASDQRIAFNGALFKVEGGKMSVVGCDGDRLAVASVKAPADDSPDASVIIPGKILTEIMKTVKDTADEMTMMIAQRHVIFEIGNFTYFARMIDSEYINYSRVIPERSEKHSFLSLSAFRSAIERAMLVTDDKLGGKANVKLNFTSDKLIVTSVATGGSVYEELPAATDGGDLTIAFNCRYLLDSLKACPDYVETVKLSMNGPLMGVAIENGTSLEQDENDMSFISFIMPVRN